MNALNFPRYDKGRSIATGLKRKCPSCERAKIFDGYLTLKKECPHCSAPIGQIRADDLPPYLTILIVGHIIVPALLYVEFTFHPSMMFQMILWPSLGIALSLSLLPVIKGAVVGLMWSIGMKGDEQR